jgi:hypothetical protein
MFNASFVLWRSVGLAALFLASSGCAVLSDNGTHLAFALERESRALVASGKEERVFDYSPMSGINQHYEVRLTPSRSPVPPYGGYVVVTGENGGGTNYQAHFVYIVAALKVSKFNEATHITLRNHDGRVELTSLR